MGEQSDRYRRDSLGFVDEGLNFDTSRGVKESSIPDYAEVWGELFISAAGTTNFKFHVEKGVDFQQARECLIRFVRIIQQRIDTAKECPFYEPERNKAIDTEGQTK